MSALLHPYNYTVSNDTYHFVTESGIEYVAYFLDYSKYGPDFYTFNFEKVSSSLEKSFSPGLYVLDTICQILSDFFQKRTNALLIVCDSSDGREEGRRRLFSQKFASVNDGSFEKVDRNGKTRYYSVYSSVIFRKDNPNKDILLRSFDQICADSLIVD